MPEKSSRRWLALALILLPLAACSRDPEVLKHKYLEGGNKYFDQGHFREARIMYISALRKDAKYAEAYYRLAKTELRLKNIDATVAPLRRAVELLPEGPDREDARVLLADVGLTYLAAVGIRKDLTDETGNLARDLLELHPDSYAGRRINGMLARIQAVDLRKSQPLESRTQLEVCTAELSAANKIKPFQPEAVEPLAECLEMSGRISDAEKLLLQAIEGNKAFLGGYRKLYRYYIGVGRFDDAERILQVAIRNNPKEYGFLFDLAMYYQTRGKQDDARKIVQGMVASGKDFPAAYELAGDFYYGIGKSIEAIQLYEKGIAAFPGDKLTYQTRIVRTYLAQGKKTEAQKVNDAILKEHPKDVPAISRSASLLLDKGEVNQSIDRLNAALAIDPNSSQAHYDLARALIAVKRPELVHYHLSEAIKWSPRFLAARLLLAQLDVEAGAYKNAVDATEVVMASTPSDRRAHLIHAMGLRGLQKYDKARAELSFLVASNPRDPSALFQLGVLENAAQKWKQAEGAFLASYNANPLDLRGLKAAADLHMAQRQYDEALTLLRTEVKRYPERADLQAALAEYAGRAGRLGMAESEMEIAFRKVDPNSPASAELHRKLAQIQISSGSLREALPHLERARELQPGDATTLFELGALYDRLGRLKDAVPAYAASVKIDSGNIRALNNLAYTMSETGEDLDKALTFAQHAQQLAPDKPEIADTVGSIYLKKNLLDEALEIFEENVKKRPDYALFRYHLGLALLQNGDLPKAKQEFEKALANHPSPEESGKIQAQLAKIGTRRL
jgi:tetratricopeptide (TPR) repeat protein